MSNAMLGQCKQTGTKMSGPHCMSNFTGSEWAAWVQAIGSILAIVGATGIALWQSRKQHENSLKFLRTAHRITRFENSQALLFLSKNSLCMLNNSLRKIPDRGAVYLIAHGEIDLDLRDAYSHEDEHLFATKVNTFFPSPHPFQILA